MLALSAMRTSSRQAAGVDDSGDAAQDASSAAQDASSAAQDASSAAQDASSAAQDASSAAPNNTTPTNLPDAESHEGVATIQITAVTTLGQQNRTIGSLTSSQPIVLLKRLRTTPPCRDKTQIDTKPQEPIVVETYSAISVGNVCTTGDKQPHLGDSSISIKSGPDDADFGSDEDECNTNSQVVDTLIDTLQSEYGDQEPQTNEQHILNITITDPRTLDTESSGQSVELAKESSTKGKANTKRRPYTKRKYCKKGTAKGDATGNISSNTGTTRINTTNINVQKTYAMSLRQRRLSQGRIRAVTAKKLRALQEVLTSNISRPGSSIRMSPAPVSEFSCDNRPLTCYAQKNKTNKSAPNKRSQPSDPYDPDMIFAAPSYPKRIPRVPPDRIPKRVQSHLPEPVAGPSGLQNTLLVPVAGPSGLQRVTTEPVAGPSGLGVISAVVSGPSGLQRITMAPVPGPSEAAPVAGPSHLQMATTEPVPAEGRLIFGIIEKAWIAKSEKMLDHAIDPLKAQRRLDQKEELFWRYVLQGKEHICVASAAIDTGSDNRTLTIKNISQEKDNILSFLGPVSGLTAPTLNLGMAFSTKCFYYDPHAVSWMDVLHKGHPRIWYAIPPEQSENFRKAVSVLCPAFCQRKSLWLSPNTTMIPPQLLREHNVSVTRIVQEEHEIVLSFPYGFTSFINTGYSESESFYFASLSWLHSAYEVFKEARENCEPTMFSLEELLFRIGKASRVDRATLTAAQPIFDKILRNELTNRLILQERGMKIVHQPDVPQPQSTGRRRRRNRTVIQENCEYCRAPLFFSKNISQEKDNIHSFMGPASGLTAPTLNLGILNEMLLLGPPRCMQSQPSRVRTTGRQTFVQEDCEYCRAPSKVSPVFIVGLCTQYLTGGVAITNYAITDYS
uniref:SFRICE_012045 n=1 Tax=Spodoptera frugiperda TaxID=7108 RepID=A0A2H1VMC5_SPOFR